MSRNKSTRSTPGGDESGCACSTRRYSRTPTTRVRSSDLSERSFSTGGRLAKAEPSPRIHPSSAIAHPLVTLPRKLKSAKWSEHTSTETRTTEKDKFSVSFLPANFCSASKALKSASRESRKASLQAGEESRNKDQGRRSSSFSSAQLSPAFEARSKLCALTQHLPHVQRIFTNP